MVERKRKAGCIWAGAYRTEGSYLFLFAFLVDFVADYLTHIRTANRKSPSQKGMDNRAHCTSCDYIALFYLCTLEIPGLQRSK